MVEILPSVGLSWRDDHGEAALGGRGVIRPGAMAGRSVRADRPRAEADLLEVARPRPVSMITGSTPRKSRMGEVDVNNVHYYDVHILFWHGIMFCRCGIKTRRGDRDALAAFESWCRWRLDGSIPRSRSVAAILRLRISAACDSVS